VCGLPYLSIMAKGAIGHDSDGIDNEVVALVMPDGPTMPGCREVGRMLLVHLHLPELVTEIKERNFVWLL
jgi:hypothetical protein